MKYKSIYLIISATVILPGVVSLILFGLKPGLDFTGGSRLELALGEEKEATVSGERRDQIASAAAWVKPVGELLTAEKVDYEEVRSEGSRLILKTKEIDESRKNHIIEVVSQKLTKVSESRFETLGPVLGRELLKKTIIGILLAALFIAFYIIYQFKDLSFGLCATLATVHDSLVILGIFSLMGRFWGIEVDTLFVTAVLTVLSFSVHDTIVVYDRVREKMLRRGYQFSQLSKSQLEEIIDEATNETLVRSLNNSLTVIFMLTSLFVLGGTSTRWFYFALLVGTVSGTYSSPFVAGPLLILFRKLNIWAESRRTTRK